MEINEKPKTVAELFAFYYSTFKPIYSHVQALNQPPVEMFFEISAALDHLSRYWYYGEQEEGVVDRAASHLKRGCFDAFKIILRETRDHYDALRRLDTSIIDNGRFDQEMIRLFARIKCNSIDARMAEGDSRNSRQWHQAFDKWKQVYVDCVRFEREFFLAPTVDWARTKQVRGRWRLRFEGVAISFVAAVIFWLLFTVIGGSLSIDERTADPSLQRVDYSATAEQTQSEPNASERIKGGISRQ
jgi:hypothetical protein